MQRPLDNFDRYFLTNGTFPAQFENANNFSGTYDSAKNTGKRPKWFPKWNKKSADFTFHVPFFMPILIYKC